MSARYNIPVQSTQPIILEHIAVLTPQTNNNHSQGIPNLSKARLASFWPRMRKYILLLFVMCYGLFFFYQIRSHDVVTKLISPKQPANKPTTTSNSSTSTTSSITNPNPNLNVPPGSQMPPRILDIIPQVESATRRIELTKQARRRRESILQTKEADVWALNSDWKAPTASVSRSGNIYKQTASSAGAIPAGPVVEQDSAAVKQRSSSSSSISSLSSSSSSSSSSSDSNSDSDSSEASSTATSPTTVSSFSESLHHEDEISGPCAQYTSDLYLSQWRNNRQVVCEKQGARSETFVLRDWEYEPVVKRYSNVVADSMHGTLIGPCGEMELETPQSAIPPILVNHTVIKLSRFDITNPYEAHHGFLTVYSIIRMLNLSDFQFVFVDDMGKVDNNHEMWVRFTDNSARPPLYPKDVDNDFPLPQGPFRFKDLIVGPVMYTSILVTKARDFSNPLRGRGALHHCKSPAYRDANEWIANKFGLATRSHKRPGPIKVLFSARRPHLKRGVEFTPHRTLQNESQFLQQLAQALGNDYLLRDEDFGKLSVNQSIAIAIDADIMVGIHGAGLLWASFLPRHGGLVEIMGGDRFEVDRHYHNMASLADIHYRRITFPSRARNLFQLHWDPDLLHALVNEIKSIVVQDLRIEPNRRR